MKYIHNEIVQPFMVGILQYAECVPEMHKLAKYLPPPSVKERKFYQADWNVFVK